MNRKNQYTVKAAEALQEAFASAAGRGEPRDHTYPPAAELAPARGRNRPPGCSPRLAPQPLGHRRIL